MAGPARNKLGLSDFSYLDYKLDPKPRVLVLGAWKNPKTGNDLIGGININYLTKDEYRKLKHLVIPKIRKLSGLRQRYRVGKFISAELFDNYYRTYNVESIRKAEYVILPEPSEKEPEKEPFEDPDEKVKNISDLGELYGTGVDEISTDEYKESHNLDTYNFLGSEKLSAVFDGRNLYLDSVDDPDVIVECCEFDINEVTRMTARDGRLEIFGDLAVPQYAIDIFTLSIQLRDTLS